MTHPFTPAGDWDAFADASLSHDQTTMDTIHHEWEKRLEMATLLKQNRLTRSFHGWSLDYIRGIATLIEGMTS